MSQTLKPRNPVAQSPLLRKGGVHEKSATAKRQQTRTGLNRQLDDWQDDLAFEREMQHIIDQKDLVDDAFHNFKTASNLLFVQLIYAV